MEYLSIMTTGCKIKNQSDPHFVTFTVIDWVDIFSRKIYRDIILDSLKFCRKEKGLQLRAYVVMTNHVHAIMSARQENLSDIIRDFKRHTSSTILKSIQSVPESREDWMLKRFEFAARSNARTGQYQFWQNDNHPEVIYSASFFQQKLNYIHQNPVKAGWVEKPEDWLYSSARNYLDRNPLMEIDLSDDGFQLFRKLKIC